MESMASKETDLTLAQVPLPTIPENNDNVTEQQLAIPNTTLNQTLAQVPSPTIPENNDNVTEQQLAIPNTTLNQRISNGPPLDPNLDSKKLKRIMASRQYSQKYRLKQMNHILQLEQDVKTIEAEVSIAGPKVQYVRSQNALLRAENNSLKQKISAKSGEILFKEALFEELTKEKEMLTQIYQAKQMQVQQEQPPADFFMVGPAPAENYQHLDVNLNQPSFNPYLGPAGFNGGGSPHDPDHDQFENFNSNINMNQPSTDQFENFNSNINMNQPSTDQFENFNSNNNMNQPSTDQNKFM